MGAYFDVNARLRELADQLDNPENAWHVAAELRALTVRNLAELPIIDPVRDDLGHWYTLPRARLLSEIGADAWNLAAGLHELATREDRQDAHNRLLGIADRTGS